MTEATPLQQVQDHDGVANERQDEGDDPIPHYAKDVQEMLRAKIKVQSVGPVRMNVVQRSKKAGRRVNGVLIESMRNNVKRESKKRIQQLIDEQTARDTISMKG